MKSEGNLTILTWALLYLIRCHSHAIQVACLDDTFGSTNSPSSTCVVSDVLTTSLNLRSYFLILKFWQSLDTAASLTPSKNFWIHEFLQASGMSGVRQSAEISCLNEYYLPRFNKLYSRFFLSHLLSKDAFRFCYTRRHSPAWIAASTQAPNFYTWLPADIPFSDASSIGEPGS